FRPAWGQLGDLRIRLPTKVAFQVLSGTLPPHIKKAVIQNLLFKPSRLAAIKLSSNCANITYAIHEVPFPLSDFRNLDFLVPNPYPAGFTLCKTIVFHDDRQLAQNTSNYMNMLLPLDLQKKGIIQHYHSAMSTEYLKTVFEDFASPTGVC
ncbi:hypothetical protein BDQ17DRAFT_1249590, partial [Cyathus striatus]